MNQEGEAKIELLKQLNRAMTFIEEHIYEDITLESISSVTMYSEYHFGRLFYYIAEMPLSEYVRKRKLSHAAIDLQSSHDKVIDLAIKYGYDSAQKNIIQLENVKTELHTAKSHAGNAGRLMLGKEVKAARAQNPERGVLAGVQKFLLRTSVLLTNIGKVADSAMRKIGGLGERSEKTSVDKSIKEIKTARTDSKTPTLGKEARESR